MNQAGQNSNYPYNTYGYSTSKFDNNVPNTILSDNTPSINTASNTSSSLNAAPAKQNGEIVPKFDNEDFDSTGMSNPPPNHEPFNMSYQNMAGPGPRTETARNIQAAHTVGPVRRNPSRGMTSQAPYARPRSHNVQSHSQSMGQKSVPRQKPTCGMSVQNSTNAYTLPRTRSQSKAVQPQAQPDASHDMRSGLGGFAPGASSNPGSVSPFNSTDLNASGGTFIPDTSGQVLGVGAVTPSLANTTFVRPVHHSLDSSRIDPAGPETHPNPQWRAPGPHQWAEILHDYTLLQYLSDAAIKDLLKHCDRLVGSGVQDPANPTGPALVEGGPYTVLDAQAVWNYCTAYTKRRQQHRNNSAASRSRNNKAAQLKHWKALALAAGAPDRDFVFDINDPGNATGAPSTLLAAATQIAIDEMKKNWASTTGGGAAQAPVATMSLSRLGHRHPVQQLNQPQTQQQVFGQPQSKASPPFIRRNTAHLTTMEPQVVAAAAPTREPKAYTLTSPPKTAPPASTTSAVADTDQANDMFEEFKLDLIPLEDDFLKELNASNNQDMYNGGFDFGGGNT